MPTIRKRKEGYYFLDLYVDGKRNRISLDTKDRQIARARATLREREISAGGSPGKRIRLDDFIAEHKEYSAARKSPATVKAERYSTNRLNKDLQVTYLDQLTPHMADQLVTKMSADGLSPAGINFHIRTLKSIFSAAVKWEYLEANPFRKVKQISYEKPMPRILTIKEIEAVLAKARELRPQIVPLLEFLVLTGVRRGEALNLNWSDVNAEANYITIRKTKGKRPRVLPIIPRVKSLLAARRALERPFPFDGSHISNDFRQIADAAGITDITLHDLRRSFASYIQDVGMPTLFVTWLIGHMDQEVTRQHYTGFDNAMIMKYLMRLERKILPK